MLYLNYKTVTQRAFKNIQLKSNTMSLSNMHSHSGKLWKAIFWNYSEFLEVRRDTLLCIGYFVLQVCSQKYLSKSFNQYVIFK